MKKRFAIIVAVLTLALSAPPDASGQWMEVNTPLYVQIQCFAASDSALFAGTTGGMFRSTDSGFNWSYANLGLYYSKLVTTLIVTGAGNSTMVLAGTDSGIYRSTNFGILWTRMSNGLTNDTVNALAQINNGITNILFAGTNNGLFRSTDSGGSWIAANFGLTDSSISCFTTTRQDIFAGITHQFPSRGASFYRSTDEGMSWTGIDTSLLAGGIISMTIGGTFVSPILYAGTYASTVCSSTNGGFVWKFIGNTPAEYPSSLLVHGDTLFVAFGVIGFTADNGTNWSIVEDDIANVNPVNALMMADSYFFAGAKSGIWRASWGIKSAVELTSPTTSHFTTYPNPFSQSTTINFTTPESGVATVAIVNILGATVARIFSGELDAGTHTFTWDARGLPAGMYECIVHMNGRLERSAMVVN